MTDLTEHDAALLARIDNLPTEAQARARAVIDMMAGVAGRLQTVDVDQDADGGVHIILRFECDTWDFVSPCSTR